MMSKLVLGLSIAVFCAACGGTEPGTGGTGGTGGSTGGTGGTGATGGSTTTTTTGGTGGTGGSACSSSPVNVYDNTTETGLPACDNPVAPLPEEDGTFAVTIFGPFATPFQVTGFTFAALESETTAVTDPWTASVTVVPAGSEPTLIDPNDGAKPYALTVVEDIPNDPVTIHRLSITLDAPLTVNACDTVVVALRNTVGPPLTAIQMCGTGSAHPDTNQWWNLDGTMAPMASFGNNFNRDWWVSLLVTE